MSCYKFVGQTWTGQILYLECISITDYATLVTLMIINWLQVSEIFRLSLRQFNGNQ